MSDGAANTGGDEHEADEPSVVDVDVDSMATRALRVARIANGGVDPEEPYDPDAPGSAEPVVDETTPIFASPSADDEDRYEIGDEIARGGMGAIHEVRDTSLRRRLAMKVALAGPRGSRAASRDPLRRFLEEAQVTAQLAHPGVVPIHELGIDRRGRAYFTMSMVRGETLAVVIRKARAEEDGWTRTRALHAILRVCETLAFAHSRGVIHRDIKPANIMVGKFGQTYVMDWGVAKITGRDDAHDLRIRDDADDDTDDADDPTATNRVGTWGARERPITTMDGIVIGTPAYMPPEQAAGRVSQVDKRSDVYAIGALLYQLMTGVAPYVKRDTRVSMRTVLEAVRSGPPTSIATLSPSAPPELQAICEKAMARAPSDRYVSAEEMADDLERYLDGRVVHAHRTGVVIELKKWVRRNRAVAATAAVAVVLLTLASIVYTIHLGAARDDASEAARREGERAREAETARGEAMAARERERERAEEAERARDAKSEALRKARALGLVTASAEVERIDPMTSLVLARAAVATRATPVTVRRLRTAIAGNHERVVLRGHERGVDTAIYSPDGSRIATVSPDGTARLWDVTGRELVVLRSAAARDLEADPVRRSREGPVGFASFAPDGSRIVVYSFDQTARVWDMDGNEIGALQGHEGPISAASFSPDGTTIVTASRDGTARIWTPEGKELATLNGHGRAVLSAEFSPDGTRILTASQDGKGGIWSVEGHAIEPLIGHEGPVRSAAYSADGTRIVTASDDRTARIWDAEGGEVAVLRGHEDVVWSAAFSSDGTHVLTSSWDGTARIWTVDGNEVVVLRGHELPLIAAAYSRDGSLIVTASFDGTARVWSSDGNELAVLRGHTHMVSSATFSPDGAHVVTASNDRTARLWDVDGGEVAVLRGHAAELPGASYSPDGTRMVTASWDGTARVWSASGKPVSVLRGHEAAVWSAAFSPDGQRIVTSSYDRTARIWSLDGRELAVLSGHDDTVLFAAFSPGGGRVVTASADGTARTWDANGKEIRELSGHGDAVWTASFSPDGKRILTASWDRTARVWSEQGEELVVLRGHEGRVSSAAFSADGDRVVTASWDRTARVWSTAGEQLAVLRGHESVVWSAAFSPDGARIVTGSGDKTARTWDIHGMELAVLHGHAAPVRCVAFSADGTRILTASEDRTARIWLVETAAVLALAESRITRDMTDVDRDLYAPLLDDE